METDDPAQLDHVMAQLAGGDLAFAVTLANGWHAPIARLVRTLLREMGRPDLAGRPAPDCRPPRLLHPTFCRSQ